MHLPLLKKRYHYIYWVYQPLFFGQITFHMRVVSIPEITQDEFIVLLNSRSIKSELSSFWCISFEFTFTWIVKHLKTLFRKSFFPFHQLQIGNLIIYVYFRLNRGSSWKAIKRLGETTRWASPSSWVSYLSFTFSALFYCEEMEEDRYNI